jgi:hypothetical protein
MNTKTLLSLALLPSLFICSVRAATTDEAVSAPAQAAPAAPAAPAAAPAKTASAPAAEETAPVKAESAPVPAKVEAPAPAETPAPVKQAAVATPAPTPVPAHAKQTAAATADIDTTLVAAEPKPLAACAQPFESVAKAYAKAHDDFTDWLRGASDKMLAVDSKVADTKAMIADKQAKITKLELDSASGKPLEAAKEEVQDLWKELHRLDSKRTDLCKLLSRAAADKVKELNRSVSDALDQTKK